MQSIVPKALTANSNYKFESSPWYKEDTVNGIKVYLTTAYFTSPNNICLTGHTQDEFDGEGTGNILWFLKNNGDFHKAPLTVEKADQSVSINAYLITKIICNFLDQALYYLGSCFSKSESTSIVICCHPKHLVQKCQIFYSKKEICQKTIAKVLKLQDI